MSTLRTDAAITDMIQLVYPYLELEAGFLVCHSFDIHQSKPKNWSSHIEAILKHNDDAPWIEPGDMIQVPIFPTSDIWAQVNLFDAGRPLLAKMTLNYQPDFGNEVRVDLGFWNRGEGRWSVRDVILDYIKSRVSPEQNINASAEFIKTKCPSSFHGLPSEQELSRRHTPKWVWQCLWNIVMEGACTPCVEASSNPDPDNGLNGLDTGFRRP